MTSQEETKIFPLERKLKAPGISFICEVKRASPSKGLIAPNFPYLEIAREYEIAGLMSFSSYGTGIFYGEQCVLKRHTKDRIPSPFKKRFYR